MPAREVLACLCTFVPLASGMGLLWRRSVAVAARVLLAYLLLWQLLFKLPVIVHAPTVDVSYESCGETAVIAAGAWVLYAWFAADRDRWPGFAAGDQGVRIARGLYGLALIAFGSSHFAYAGETAALVPGWLPWHLAWAYFFGCTYVMAGVAMLAGSYARLAATLSAFQMGTFTLLVWVPAVVAGSSAFQRDEFVVSSALTASAWVMADACRGLPWFATGRYPPVAGRGS
jgi:hypothetical protein